MLPTTHGSRSSCARSSPWRLRFRRHFSSCWRRGGRAAASRWSAAAALATLFLARSWRFEAGRTAHALLGKRIDPRRRRRRFAAGTAGALLRTGLGRSLTLLALVAEPCWRAFSPTGSSHRVSVPCEVARSLELRAEARRRSSSPSTSFSRSPSSYFGRPPGQGSTTGISEVPSRS